MSQLGQASRVELTVVSQT